MGHRKLISIPRVAVRRAALLPLIAAAVVAMLWASVEAAAPIAVNDSAIVAPGETIVIDVLSNDSDPENGVLSVIAIGPPGLGSAQISGDGTITYTAKADAEGVDAFIYFASDDAGEIDSAVIAVVIAVPIPSDPTADEPPADDQPVEDAPPADDPPADDQPVEDAPPADDPPVDDQPVEDDTPDGVPSLLGSTRTPWVIEPWWMSDPEAAGTYREWWNYTSTTTINHGDWTVETYTEEGDYETTVDLGGSDAPPADDPPVDDSPPANAAPVAVNDVALPPGTAAFSIDVLANDFDPDGDQLTIVSVGQAAQAPRHTTAHPSCSLPRALRRASTRSPTRSMTDVAASRPRR